MEEKKNSVEEVAQEVAKDKNDPKQEEQKIQINLHTSLIIAPVIKFISDITVIPDNTNKENPIYQLTLVTDSLKCTFKGHATSIRALKANLIQSMQQNSIYIANVTPVLEDEESLVYELL